MPAHDVDQLKADPFGFTQSGSSKSLISSRLVSSFTHCQFKATCAFSFFFSTPIIIHLLAPSLSLHCSKETEDKEFR